MALDTITNVAPTVAFNALSVSTVGGGISLSEFLIVAAILFGLGIAGILMNRKNIIAILMSIELLLLAVNTNFIAFSHFLKNNTGEIFVFFILTVAAAEAAIGLAIMVVLFRRTHTIEVENLDTLKG